MSTLQPRTFSTSQPLIDYDMITRFRKTLKTYKKQYMSVKQNRTKLNVKLVVVVSKDADDEYIELEAILIGGGASSSSL